VVGEASPVRGGGRLLRLQIHRGYPSVARDILARSEEPRRPDNRLGPNRGSWGFLERLGAYLTFSLQSLVLHQNPPKLLTAI
jgi:hypothetical protein